MNFFSSIRKKVATFLGPTDPNRVQFDNELLRKIQTLCAQLQKKKKRNKEANALLAELLKPLQSLSWDYADARQSVLCRQHLLQLCEAMIVALDYIGPAERFNYYKGVGYLVRRLEYGGELLLKDGDVSGEEIAICLQYRELLFSCLKQTMVILTPPETHHHSDEDKRKDGAGEEGGAKPRMLEHPAPVVQAYCAQILAVLAFRIPGLTDCILKHGLDVTEAELRGIKEEQKSVTEMLPKSIYEDPPRGGDEHEGLPKHSSKGDRKGLLSAVGGGKHAGLFQEDKDKGEFADYFLQPFSQMKMSVADHVQEQCPGLFGWKSFHKKLLTLDTKKRSVDLLLEEVGVEWIRHHMHRSSPIFHLFFKFWLEHVTLVQDSVDLVPHLEFRDIFPYRSFTRAFLMSFCESEERPRTMSDCAVALLGAEPGIITFLFKSLMLSTDGSEFASILDSLVQIEFWLKQLTADGETLPEDFDYDFMCVAFDRILMMEHHVVSARLIAMIYTYSNVFVDEGRMKLFGELLLNKYGFMLFLLWDANTRSIFHQFLVFKMLRISRKDLRSAQPQHSKVFEQDRMLLTKQEAIVRVIKKQIEEKDKPRDPDMKPAFDPHWEAYVPRALEEFNTWLAKYNENPSAVHKLQVFAERLRISAMTSICNN